MNIIPSVLISVALLISCSTKKKEADGYYPEPKSKPAADTSIHPLLDIGGCYAYRLNNDTTVGVIVIGVIRELDEIYYSLMPSAGFFKDIPTPAQFRKTGIWTRKIPVGSVDGNDFILSFEQVSIAEKDLIPFIAGFRKVDSIKIAADINIGRMGGIKTMSELPADYDLHKLHNDKVARGSFEAGKYPYKVSSFDLIPLADKTGMAVPINIWRLTKKTAHLRATELMQEDWFWEEANDLSPFGNDDGSDALYGFKNWRTAYPTVEPAAYLDELERSGGLSFSHRDIDSESKLPEVEKTNQFYRNVDRSIIGVAFAQLALEGKVSSRLKELAIKAIHRTQAMFTINDMREEDKAEYQRRLEKMESILNQL